MLVFLAALSLLAPFAAAQQTAGSCNATNPCTGGMCCSEWGFCGVGDTYCGKGCVNGPCVGSGKCTAAVPCAAGFCCSANGFCGKGADYCGTGCTAGPCLQGAPPAPSAPMGACSKTRPCLDSSHCCSQYGFCGTGADYCGVGCQFGPCLAGTITAPDGPKSSPSRLSAGAIAGIAIAWVVGVIAITAVVVFIVRRRRAMRQLAEAEVNLPQDKSLEVFQKVVQKAIRAELANNTATITADRYERPSVVRVGTEEGSTTLLFAGRLDGGSSNATRTVTSHHTNSTGPHVALHMGAGPHSKTHTHSSTGNPPPVAVSGSLSFGGTGSMANNEDLDYQTALGPFPSFVGGAHDATATVTMVTGAGMSRANEARRLEAITIPWSSLVVIKDRVRGQGGFGTVYEGLWEGVRPVAIKMLNSDRLTPESLAALRQEALIMCHKPEPFVATVFGLVDEGNHHALVMQLYKRGSLSKAMLSSDYSLITPLERYRTAQQVAVGMRNLHNRRPLPVIHGDLKCSNLLIDNDGKSVVIADFGLAACLRRGRQGVDPVGALSYRISPPEVLINHTAPRTTAGDVYAFGITMLEIVTGQPVFRSFQNNEIVKAVVRGDRPAIPESVPESIQNIITACWAQRPEHRPTFAEVCVMLADAIREIQDKTLGANDQTATIADLTQNPTASVFY